MDAVSSWWVNLFGHGRREIADAIAEQAHTLEQVMFAGHTHEPAVRLAERLCALAPGALNRVFFADNGSSAIEVALKMSFHYWANRGQQRRYFVHLDQGYHGETLGALAVSDVGLYKTTYQPLLMQALQLAAPDTRRPDRSADVERCLAGARQLLEERGQDISAVIIEPLVQCAAGMRMHEPAFVKGLSELCKEFDVHLIADEIAVGFGRSGRMFACEHAQIAPDFLCLSKGITGGFLPLAVVLTADDVYAAFYAEWKEQKAFLHSHSYTGNAIACAAANAVLDIFAAEPVFEHLHTMGALMETRVRDLLSEHPHVAHIRRQGMMLALDLVQAKQPDAAYPALERRGLRAYQHALTRETMLRPLYNTMYLMPPYVVQEEDVEHLCSVLAESVDVATRDSN
jgi:adenosylmethionine-8-amino-7-oxononanoate aminotransferase